MQEEQLNHYLIAVDIADKASYDYSTVSKVIFSLNEQGVPYHRIENVWRIYSSKTAAAIASQLSEYILRDDTILVHNVNNGYVSMSGHAKQDGQVVVIDATTCGIAIYNNFKDRGEEWDVIPGVKAVNITVYSAADLLKILAECYAIDSSKRYTLDKDGDCLFLNVLDEH